MNVIAILILNHTLLATDFFILRWVPSESPIINHPKQHPPQSSTGNRCSHSAQINLYTIHFQLQHISSLLYTFSNNDDIIGKRHADEVLAGS